MPRPPAQENTAAVNAVDDGSGRRGRPRAVVLLAATAVIAGVAGGIVGVAVERSSAEGAAKTVTTLAQAVKLQATGTLTPEQIAAAATPGVVSILATSETSSGFPSESSEAVSQGSGFVLDRAGHIVTSQHVIQSATKIHVSFADGTKVHATVVSSDRLLDLAVLSVPVPAAKLHPLTLGSSADLRVGDTVVAIGSPFGYDQSVSVGVVSGLHRQVVAPNGFRIPNAVQTDAPINHGNSGGPVLDGRGRVIGVSDQLADSGVDGNVGVAFAVAIDANAGHVIAELRAGKRVRHAWVGISLDDIDAILATSGRIRSSQGVLVTGVVAGGPAARAGVRGGSELTVIDGLQYCLGGDVITAFDGHAVTSSGEFQSLVYGAKPGAKVTVSVVRAGGATKRLTITLGTQPDTRPEATTGCA
jgi:2-alkenal reductase